MANRSDDFNRTDTTNAIGTPSDGGSSWEQTSGSWGISTNRGYLSTVTSQAICVLESSLSSSVDVQVKAAVLGVDAGLVARVSDNSNYILGAFGSGGAMRLWKRVAGTFTQLGSTYNGTLASGDVFKLSVGASNDLTLYQNGSSRVTATESHNSTATKHGMRIEGLSDSTTKMDDFSITAQGGGDTPQIYYYQQMMAG